MPAALAPTVADLVAALGGELLGDAALVLHRIAPLDKAGADDVSFLAGANHQAKLATSDVGCVILPTGFREIGRTRCAAILTDDPYLYFARLTQWWVRRQVEAVPVDEAGIHVMATIDARASLGAGVRIGAYCVVGPEAVIDAGVTLASHVVVGARARIGAGTRLASHVQVGDDCVLGQRCVVHGGAVIGADGFGFAPCPQGWEKIEQLGAVRIGDDVEIGANTCIDRGALEDTVIGSGVKLDNLIQIAHNVHVGSRTAMAACVGVAGSARIGANCTVGGGAGILGHLELVDGVHVSSFSLVSRSLRQPGQYTGVFPLDDNASWEKNAATLRQLHALRERLRAVEKKQNSS